MASRFSIEAVFKGIDKLSAPVTRMQNKIRRFVRNTETGIKSISDKTSFMGNAFKTALGVAGITGGLFLMQSAMISTISTGVEFEQTLVNAAAKFPGGIRKGTVEFKRLEDAARRVGLTTEFTASQGAGALNFLAMAGFNANQSIAALPGIVDLATASGLDLARASDIATDSLGSFNLLTKDTVQLQKNLARVNDVMAKTTVTSNTNMEQLFESLREAGPIATTAGASLETVAAMAGTLANAGIKGSDAGTTLKNVFVRLAAPVGGAAKLLRKLGVATKDSAGNLRDVTDVIGDLNKSMEGLGTAEQTAVLEEIFGKIPLAGVNILLKSGTENLKSYRKELENAGGESGRMATMMRDTFSGSIKSAKSALEGLGLTIFQQVAPSMRLMLDGITPLVRGLADLLQSNKDIIPGILEVVRNVLLVTAVFGGLKLAIWAVSLAMKMTPFGLVVGILTVLVALLPILIRNFDEVKKSLKAVWFSITESLQPVFDMFQELVNFVSHIIEGIDIIAGKPIRKLFDFGAKVVNTFTNRKSEEGPEVIAPEERIARRIEENRTTNSATLTIQDRTGRAELSGDAGPGISLNLARSGAF